MPGASHINIALPGLSALTLLPAFLCLSPVLEIGFVFCFLFFFPNRREPSEFIIVIFRSVNLIQLTLLLSKLELSQC